MIPTTLPAMLIFDLIILGLIIATVIVSVVKGIFRKSFVPMTGRMLVISGLIVAGIVCAIDVMFILDGPDLTPDQRILAGTDVVRGDLRWLGALLSVIPISVGFMVILFQRERIHEKISQSELLASDARESATQSDVRFIKALEQSMDSIYCFEFRPPISTDLPTEEQVARSFDAVLIECNLAFARSVGKDSRDEARGMRLRDMRMIMSDESHALFHRKFVENGYWLVDYEYSFVNEQGENELLLINATGDVENGHLVRLWGSERNILEQAKLGDTLADRLRFQESATRMSTELLLAKNDDIKDVLVRSLENACRHIEADRITIVWLEPNRRTAEAVYFWNESGSAPWPKFSLNEAPFLGSRLLQGRPVAFNSCDDLARESVADAQLMARIGVKSFAAVPLIVDGDVVGVCAVAVTRKEKNWTSFNISDLQSFSVLFANVVFRIKSNAVLNQAMVDLKAMRDRLEAENIYLRQEIIENNGFDELIGQSESLRRCLHQVQQVAATNTAVLVHGETGTGKELIVRAIHQLSDRSDRPLVKVNCAALPADLIESELFGHEKGAFTGAISRKRGRFDLADGGTLFLDEIGDFPLELQGKLLRVLQEGEFQRVGGNETLKVDVRLIAATNRELQMAVDVGQFRADLYYRISVYPINLPPLRERDGDVALLAEHFVHKHASGLGKRITAISALMMDQLEAYSWPGNVRELESVIQRSIISANGPVLKLTEILGIGLESRVQEIPGAGVQSADLLAVEKAHIERVLNHAGWVVAGGTGAAVKLGVPPSTLRSKMKKLGIRRPS